MAIKNLLLPITFGIGVSISFAALAFSPYEKCVIDCHKSYHICKQGGGSEATCSSLRQRCIWGCGTPQ